MSTSQVYCPEKLRWRLELQILVCYDRPDKALAIYKLCRQVGTCFRAMKYSGFNIEDAPLRDIERIERLTAMVCPVLVWAYRVGEHKDLNVRAIRVLEHGRKEKTLVKYGLEEIANVLMRERYLPKFMFSNFCHVLKIMSMKRRVATIFQTTLYPDCENE